MYKKILIATGAVLLLALGTAFAEARPNRGGGFGSGGFGGGGPRIGSGNFGGFRGGNIGRSFRGGSSFNRSRNFSGGRGMRNYRNFSHRGPSARWNNRGWRHGHRHRHRHRGRIIVGAPFYDYGYYGGYYGDDCGWLYRRAIATGSPYWWRRYQNCEY